MTVRINKQKINLREKLTEFEDKVNFDEVVRGLGEYTGNVGIGVTSPDRKFQVKNNGATNSYAFQVLGGNTDGNRIAGIMDIYVASTGRSAGALALHESGSTTSVFLSAYPNQDSYINNGGNVGIGTTDPDTALHISSNSPSIRLTDTTPTTDTVSQVWADSDYVGALLLAADITSVGSDPFVSFRVGGTGVATEKMRITGAGNVGIGTDDPTSIVSSSTAINAFAYIKSGGYGVFTSDSAGPALYINKTNATTSEATDYINFRNKGNITGSIEYDGADVNIVQASDARLKENIQDSESGLNLVNNLKVRSFDWVGEKRQSKKFGFVAQEMHEVFEEAVKIGGEDENESPWGVFDSKLIPVLTKAIQEQQSIIEDLKSRIETLESK